MLSFGFLIFTKLNVMNIKNKRNCKTFYNCFNNFINFNFILPSNKFNAIDPMAIAISLDTSIESNNCT